MQLTRFAKFAAATIAAVLIVFSPAQAWSELQEWRGIYHEIERQLILTDGTVLQVEFSHKEGRLEGRPYDGSDAVIRGFQRSNGVAVADEFNYAPRLLPPVLGKRRIALVLFRYEDSKSSGADADLLQSIKNKLSDGPSSLKAYFEDVSFGQLTVDIDTFGIFKLSAERQKCVNLGGDNNLPPSLGNAMLEAANASVANLGLYDHIVLWIDNPYYDDGCANGNLVGKVSRYYFPFNFNDSPPITPIIAHEIGHNFGWMHANRLDCTNPRGRATLLSGTCESREYADSGDVMGSGLRHPNAWRKYLVGWLPAESVHEVKSSGVFELSPLECAPGDTVALRFLHGTPPWYSFYANSPTYSDIWLQYRVSSRFDVVSQSTGIVEAHLLPRFADDYYSNTLDSSNLLVRDPKVYQENILPFKDPKTQISVTSLGFAGTKLGMCDRRAVVQIRFPGERLVSPKLKGLARNIVWRRNILISYSFKLNNSEPISCLLSGKLARGLIFNERECRVMGRTTRRMSARAYMLTAWFPGGSKMVKFNALVK